MSPGPFTLAELVSMAEARLESDWGRTSVILALIANVNRDPKKTRPFKPGDFNPFAPRQKSGVVLTSENIGILKQAFVDGKTP